MTPKTYDNHMCARQTDVDNILVQREHTNIFITFYGGSDPKVIKKSLFLKPSHMGVCCRKIENLNTTLVSQV